MKNLLEPFGEYKRPFNFSSVNIETGAIVNLTEKNLPFKDAHLGVIASGSVPVAFPPIELNGMKLVDGMTAYNTHA